MLARAHVVKESLLPFSSQPQDNVLRVNGIAVYLKIEEDVASVKVRRRPRLEVVDCSRRVSTFQPSRPTELKRDVFEQAYSTFHDNYYSEVMPRLIASAETHQVRSLTEPVPHVINQLFCKPRVPFSNTSIHVGLSATAYVTAAFSRCIL